jgi:hypothetical protein
MEALLGKNEFIYRFPERKSRRREPEKGQGEGDNQQDPNKHWRKQLDAPGHVF